MLKNTILKCVICISLLIICLFSLSGCINYIPITPDDSGETSVIQPSDESGKPVNFVVAKGEDLKEYFGEAFTETVTRASQSVVSVVASYSDGKGGLTKKNASGVVLGSLDDETVESSYIVVPHHLIVGASIVSVFVDGSETAIASTYVGTDPRTDLCVLHIKKKLTPALIGDIPLDDDGNEYPSVGKSVFTIGDALGKKVNIVSKGIICADNYKVSVGEGKYEKYLLTDAFVSSSSSGGGLFSENGGLLMGIINGSIDEGSGWNGFVIPVSTAVKVCKEIIQNDEHCVAGRYKLGFTVEDVRTSWGPTENVKISEVTTDGSFYAGGNGLRAGDLILGFRLGSDTEMITVNSAEEVYNWFYTELADRLKVGERIIFTIKRNGTEDDIAIEIKQYKFSSDRY